MGCMRESNERLHKNVRAINSGEAVHPVSEQLNAGHGVEAGKEMYRRFYGQKQP